MLAQGALQWPAHL